VTGEFVVSLPSRPADAIGLAFLRKLVQQLIFPLLRCAVRPLLWLRNMKIKAFKERQFRSTGQQQGMISPVSEG
jgi:hypothetical protein